MHLHFALALSAFLTAGLLRVHAQSDGATPDVRAEFRAQLSRCAPAVLLEICTNRVADRLDPALCDAVRSLTSGNAVQRGAGEKWIGAAGMESGMALLVLKLGNRAAGGEAIRWMASNASPVSVGMLLDSYDRAAAALGRGVFSDDAHEALAAVRGDSLAALKHVHGTDLARECGIDLGSSSSGLVSLAIVQFSREKWFAYKAAGMPERRWEMERARLFEFLAARAVKAD